MVTKNYRNKNPINNKCLRRIANPAQREMNKSDFLRLKLNLWNNYLKDQQGTNHIWLHGYLNYKTSGAYGAHKGFLYIDSTTNLAKIYYCKDSIEARKYENKPPESIVIFVNGHHNVFLPGPSLGGKGYWSYFDVDHLEDAKNYFGLSTLPYPIYIDGSSMIGGDSDFNDRFQKGTALATERIDDWKAICGNMPIYIIAHSEGVAYAAGIIDGLYGKGITINEAIYLSGDECAEQGAHTNPNVPTYQIEYMYWTNTPSGAWPAGICTANYDWVIGTNNRYQTYGGLSGVTKFGIAITKTGFSSVHGSTANLKFSSQRLKDLKQVSVVTKTDLTNNIYYDYNNSLQTKFYKINNRFIYARHPQWNINSLKIDYTLQCNE